MGIHVGNNVYVSLVLYKIKHFCVPFVGRKMSGGTHGTAGSPVVR